MAKVWLVLRYNSKCQQSLEYFIGGLAGVDFYSPRRITFTPRSNRPSPNKYEVVLFPGYMFLHFDPEEVHTSQITAFSGAYNFVSFGSHPPLVLHASVIDDLKTELETQRKELEGKLPVVINMDPTSRAICHLVKENSVAARVAGLHAILKAADAVDRAGKRHVLKVVF